MTLTRITSDGITDAAIVNADINASAAIAKTKLAALDIVNADVNASAAIAVSKLANFVNNNADDKVITGSGTANTLEGESSNYNFVGGTLRIKNSANDTQYGAIYGDATSFHLNGGSPNLLLYSGGGERMRIDSSGNVGIGTTSPAMPLHIKGNTPYIRLEDDNDNQDWQIEARAFFGIYDVNDSAFRLAIDGDGKVGIGTTNPSYALDVQAASGDASMRLRSAGTGTGDDTIFRLQVAGTTQDNFIYFGDSEDSNAGQINYNHNSNFLRFFTNAGERMRIDSSGNCGIGTTSPDIRLTVVGSGTDNLVRLGRSDANSHGSHAVVMKISKDYFHNLRMESSSYRFDTYDGSSMNHRMNIPSNGQIQILGGGNVFQLNPGGNAGTLVFNQGGVITSNIRSSDGGSNVAGGSGGGSRLFLAKNQIYMYTYNYLSNIGDAPSYSQRFRIDTSGNFHGSSSNNISDQRLKKDIATITDPLTKIKGLIGRTFKWKEDSTKFDDKTKYGFIAQEVETTIPELVDTENGIVLFDKDDKVIYDEEAVVSRSKSVNETGLIPITVEALKVLISKVEILEAKVVALEAG